MQQTTQRRVLAAVAAVGVLGAGAAATAVNSSVLDSESSEVSAANELIIPTTTSAPVSPITTAAAPAAPVVEVIRVSADGSEFELGSLSSSTTTAPGGAAPGAFTQSASPSQNPSPAGGESQSANSPTMITEFAVGGAGTVSVTGDGSTVTDVHASAGSGWSVTSARHGADWARVVFRSTDTEVTFDLTLANGQYVTDVSARALSVGTTTVAGSQYDDGYEDDDDEYENEYEDEEEEDHEDDEEHEEDEHDEEEEEEDD